ncbi:MAG: hypothetical protein WKF51_08020 [Geodermatophilaceae bacterium]
MTRGRRSMDRASADAEARGTALHLVLVGSTAQLRQPSFGVSEEQPLRQLDEREIGDNR